MPQVAYRSLIRIELRHTFFTDGLARDVVIVPEPQAAVRLRQLGWLVRGNGPELSIRSPDREESSHAEDVVLVFGVFATDASFWIYTDLADWQPGSPFVLDTATASEPDDKGSRSLPLGVLATTKLPAANAAVGLTDPAPSKGSQFALLVLRLAGGEHDPTKPGPAFHVLFSARRVHWKYLVQGAPRAATLTVHDRDGRYVFESQGLVQLANGRDAVVLCSTVPIAFQERSPLRFQLQVQNQPGRAAVGIYLANASARQLSRDTINGRQVDVAEILVEL